jgi:3-hydroxyacyl-CoA dehydrogenase
MKIIQRVAVLGAGTMGSRIAAHFANAGIPSLLLDVVLAGEKDRSRAARRGIEAAARQKPGAFFTEDAAGLIEPGNFEDDLGRVAECDWIIEAVVEDFEIKRSLWQRVGPLAAPEAILSTNTSGLPVGRLAESVPPQARPRFLGTHFFNPPRYLHLVELIPTAETDPELLAAVARFCDIRLGKGVVRCQDTPNFIANRIGSFFGATVHRLMIDGDYTIEEVDELTGPLIGLPRSASFRLLDIIGLDVWAFVAKNLYEAVPGDPWRDRLVPPPFLAEMIARGWLGEKSGQGFYRRTSSGAIEAIDWKTLEYHPRRTPKLPPVETARNIEDLGARLRFLTQADDRAGAFLWKLLRDLFLYAAERIPEVAPRVVEIDRAMRWGYNWRLGPFELWDALGLEAVTRRIEREGRSLPANVASMLAAGARAFYRPADAGGLPRTEYFDFGRTAYREIEARPGILVLADLKRARGVVKQNAGASLVDLGDGVLCAEFHSKMNALGEDAVRMVLAGLEETARNFEAMVIANEGEAFSAGANLTLLLLAAQEGEWDQIDYFLRNFQQMNMALRTAPKPVVAAPFGYTLGGGCEVVLHATRAQASAETYMGLVEVGVGLIPAGGGTKQMLINLGDPERAFELIGFAKVSSSAADARRLGLLSPCDGVTMNPERLIADAKALALSLAQNHVPRRPRADVEVGGDGVYASLKLKAWLAHQAGRISEHDLVIAEKLAHILSGGRLTGRQTVSEQYLLDLEREAFLSLCGMPKTQERIRHMLATGKPLRN